METNLKINEKICEFMKKTVHLKIMPENVWVDSKEYFDEFPKESLKKNSPLILSHVSGGLVMVFPEADYARICSGWISISAYAKAAKWGIGFDWCKNKDEFIKNIQWKVLNKNEFFEDPEKVKWFFKKFECVYKIKNTNWRPSDENCKYCNGRKCFLRDSENIEIANDLSSKSPNVIFIEELTERIREIYGVEIFKIRTYPGKHIWLKPGKCENKVKLLISRKLIVSLMEHDDKNYAREKAKETKIQVRTPENIYFQDGDELVMIEKGKVVPNDHAKQFLKVYWNRFKVDESFSNLYAALEEL